MGSTLFWRIIASAGPEMVNIKSNIAGDDEETFSLEFSHLMGLVLWGIYQIIIYVLMLNLLIAVMNTSYSELWQNVNVEWKYTKSHFVVKNSISYVSVKFEIFRHYFWTLLRSFRCHFVGLT